MRSTVSSNARSYGLRYNQRAKALDAELRDVMRTVQRDALSEARKASSGPYGRPATLRALGHPYARRAPRAIGADYSGRVNVGSGQFRAAWKTRTSINRASISVKLLNDSPHAKYLRASGTRTMVGRPVLELIQSRVPKGRAMRAGRPGAAQTKALRRGLRRAIGRPVSAYPDVLGAFTSGYRRGAALVGTLTGV